MNFSMSAHAKLRRRERCPRADLAVSIEVPRRIAARHLGACSKAQLRRAGRRRNTRGHLSASAARDRQRDRATRYRFTATGIFLVRGSVAVTALGNTDDGMASLAVWVLMGIWP